MKLIFLVLGLFLISGKINADTTTTNIGLTKPSVGSTGWGTKWNTNADTIDAAFDRIKISSWTAYTPVGSWASNVTMTGFWRRVGEVMEVQLSVALTGAPTSVVLTSTVPYSKTIDTAKLVAAGSEQIIGYGIISDASPSALIPATVFYNTTNSVLLKWEGVTASTVTLTSVSATSPVTFANNDKIVVNYSIPISGWEYNSGSN